MPAHVGTPEPSGDESERDIRIRKATMIGPFFYIEGNFVMHQIPIDEGEMSDFKLDNPYSHEKLYADHCFSGDYINIPRGRVVWDMKENKAIIYIDTCIEKKKSAVAKIAKLFNLHNYIVRHDEHYVCPKCIGNIWEDE